MDQTCDHCECPLESITAIRRGVSIPFNECKYCERIFYVDGTEEALLKLLRVQRQDHLNKKEKKNHE